MAKAEIRLGEGEGSGGIKETLTIVTGSTATAFKEDATTLSVTSNFATQTASMNAFLEYFSVSFVQGTGWSYTAKKSGRFRLYYSPTGTEVDVTKNANEVITTHAGFTTGQYAVMSVY